MSPSVRAGDRAVSSSGVTDVGPVPAFSHEAFFYAHEAEFFEATTAFVQEGLDQEDDILVAVSGARFEAVREVFGPGSGVDVVDMAVLGANPARIIPAWYDFLEAHADSGRGVRGVGEPIWAGRSEAELAECHQHEALLNVAFDDGPAWRLLCPYDVTALPGEVIDHARANHPVLVDGVDRKPSQTYHPELAARALRGEPMPPPPTPPMELAFSEGELGSVRRLVGRACAAYGVDGDAADDLVLAVDEIAANSLLHGGGRGVLRVWSEPEELVCEVSDDGQIRNPLAGRVRPPLDRLGGRGLWLANQLCELVQVRSGAAGTVVRLHARRC
jgi:anti-sigma regulatory factor (Ser/Thr protein kinase)